MMKWLQSALASLTAAISGNSPKQTDAFMLDQSQKLQTAVDALTAVIAQSRS